MPLLNNPLIDTLQISRAINTQLTQHSLGTISRSFDISYDEAIAHRADFDAEVLGEVWKHLLAMLNEKNITNLNQINSLQNNFLYTRQFGYFVDLYCKNQSAIKQLYKLVSISHTTNFYKNPRVFIDQLNDLHENFLIANSPTESDV